MSLSSERNEEIDESLLLWKRSFGNGYILRGDSGLESNAFSQIPFPRKISQFRDAFWRFLRPHTIRGTVIGTTAVVARALIENSAFIDWGLLPKALRGLLALLCGNGYIVGINQIYDIGIDKCVVQTPCRFILL